MEDFNFKKKFGQNFIKDKNNVEFYFRIKYERPQSLLSEKQNAFSKIIENRIAHTRINGYSGLTGLKYALEDNF